MQYNNKSLAHYVIFTIARVLRNTVRVAERQRQLVVVDRGRAG